MEASISADSKWSELDKLPNSIIASAEGTAMFTPPSADQEDLIVTLTAIGEYVLKLEANDDELTGAGTITINVSEDACEAAKATPGFELLTGDFDEDCDVDWDDFAVFADNWLEENSL